MIMKKIILTALSIMLLGPAFTATAQKLSPNAQIMLSRQERTGRYNMPGRATAPTDDNARELTTVSAFIAVSGNPGEVTAALRENGVTVGSQFCDTLLTAVIPVDKLRAVSELPGIEYIQMSSPVDTKMNLVRQDVGINDIHSNTSNTFEKPFTGKGVVIGIIDTGVEYKHVAFRDPKGNCRIRAVWDQNSSRGTAPAGFGYGSEYTTPEAIAAQTYDASMTYHGSHTMGIAAGSDFDSKYYGVAPEADIVFVSFDDEDAKIGDAIRYIFNYADKVDKPCVINMSLGSHFGPHDGTSALDRLIDTYSGPGRIIVGAAGNEAEFRMHASKTFTESDTQLKTMMTFSPKTTTHKIHMVDIWGTPGTNFKVRGAIIESLKGRITTTTPEADTSNPEAGPVIKVYFQDETGVDVTFMISSEINAINNAPHIAVQAEVGDIAAGRMVGVVIDGEPGQTVNLWNASNHELSSNGKSGWTDGTNSGTVGEIGGTAHRIITVGSYDSTDIVYWIDNTYSLVSQSFPYDFHHVSCFSSLGPTADGRTVPHLLAPGMVVTSAYNKYAFAGQDMLNAYTTSATTDTDGIKYYYGYDIGTSMAAPVVAGTIALMLEANPDLTPELARQYLTASTNTDDYMGELPSNSYGNGRLNALEAMKLVLGLTGNDHISADNAAEARAWHDASTGSIMVYSPAEGATVELYSMTGTLVRRAVATDTLTRISAEGLAHGVYVVRIADNATSKIVI